MKNYLKGKTSFSSPLEDEQGLKHTNLVLITTEIEDETCA
jgi:hypothetical protein